MLFVKWRRALADSASAGTETGTGTSPLKGWSGMCRGGRGVLSLKPPACDTRVGLIAAADASGLTAIQTIDPQTRFQGPAKCLASPSRTAERVAALRLCFQLRKKVAQVRVQVARRVLSQDQH
jgi:hypothetical protein